MTSTGRALEARARFPPESTSPTRARCFAEETLRGWSCPTMVDDARLLVSELVGNAVLHGGSGADLLIMLAEDHVRIEVHDTSMLPVQPREHVTVLDTAGRGLMILAALADSWGVEPDADARDGKTVWFELLREVGG